MEDNEVIEQILVHLQGYVIESDNNDSESEDIISDLEYDKKISSEEVLSFFEITKNYALSYLNRSTFPTITKVVDNVEVEVCEPVIFTGICMWTAGKIWEKYNIRENNNEDNTNPFGYGDKLVVQAKEMLKPFKYFKVMVY